METDRFTNCDSLNIQIDFTDSGVQKTFLALSNTETCEDVKYDFSSPVDRNFKEDGSINFENVQLEELQAKYLYAVDRVEILAVKKLLNEQEALFLLMLKSQGWKNSPPSESELSTNTKME